MSWRGPHPPARDVTRGCRMAHRHPPELVVVPGAAGSSSRAQSSRSLRHSTTQGRRQAATRPEHIHRNRQRRGDRAVKAIFRQSLFFFFSLPRIRYQQNRWVEEGCDLSRSRGCSSPSYYFRSLPLPSPLRAASRREFLFLFSTLVSRDACFYLRDSRLSLWSMVI